MNSRYKVVDKPSEERRKVWMTLSGDYKKRGSHLMQQQCWCWGFDIRRHHLGIRSNLLLEWGFERTPPPNGEQGATTYQRIEADGTVVTLWGFGMCFGDENGGVFISRFAFWPRLGCTCAPEAAHSPKHLTDFRSPQTLCECQAALKYFERSMLWIAEYERRVLSEIGSTHRREAFKAWGHHADAPEKIPAVWEDLSAQTQQVARLWHYQNGKKRQYIG